MASTPNQIASNSKSPSENGESQSNKTSHLPTPNTTPEKLKQEKPLDLELNVTPLFATSSSVHTHCNKKKRKLGEDLENVDNNSKKAKLEEEPHCETAAQSQPDMDASPRPSGINSLFEVEGSQHQSDPFLIITIQEKKISKYRLRARSRRLQAWKKKRAAKVPALHIFHPILRKNIRRGMIHDQTPQKLATYWEYEWFRLRPIEKFPEDEGLNFKEWKSKMDMKEFTEEELSIKRSKQSKKEKLANKQSKKEQLSAKQPKMD
ncbi:hypothetical protein B7494_g4263 [Chlorociboria aeruginascens]|nr:hypothetical protein B7494_g4263 [Chlorociboria aeruginascens]